MKKLLLFSAIFALPAGVLFAQTEISAFSATGGAYNTTFLTDYQCLGVNPANLGWTRNDHKINLGLFELTASIYSEPLTRSEVIHDLFNNDDWIDTQSEKETAIKKFTDARLLGIGAFMYLGISYQDDKIGGIAFTVRERIFWNSLLNDHAASFLFQGYNDPYFDAWNQAEGYGYSTDPEYASTVYKGTDQHFLHTREFSLGYGRQLLEIDDDITWYGGVAVKYILGYAGVQYYQNESGELIGWSALSPMYDVDYGKSTPSQVEGSGMKKVGSGFGFDLGTTFRYKDLKVGVAVNDIGSITWDGNVYEGNDVKVYKCETDGINNYNIFEQGELIVTDSDPDDPNEEWAGLENRKANLPMNLRGGASYKILDGLEAGVDVYVPLGDKVPGTYEAAIIGVGARYSPLKWLELSAGVVTGGEFGTNVPLGITMIPADNESMTWSLGVATRDVTTLFAKDNPTLSICFGFLRFSFGQK